MDTSYVTIVQYQNQELDIGTMCMYSSLPFYYVQVLCNDHYNQDTELQINKVAKKKRYRTTTTP